MNKKFLKTICKKTDKKELTEKKENLKDDDKYILLLSSVYIISELKNMKINEVIKCLKSEDIL